MPKLDESVRQEPERPAAPTRRRASTGQGDEVGLLVAIEHSRTAGYGPTNEDAIKTPFDERATDPMDCHRTEVQGVADLLV
jgi:hypothetical protein